MAQRQIRIIGLDIDESSIVATVLSLRKGSVHLDKYAVVSSLKELAADPAYRGAEVVVNLPSQMVLFRSFTLPPGALKTKNAKKEVLAFLARQSLPFKLEDCYWSWFLAAHHVHLVAARKDPADKYLRAVAEANMRVRGVCPSFMALFNLLLHTHPDKRKDRFTLINIKTASSDLLIYEAERLWTYPLALGSKDLQEQKDAPQTFCAQVQRIFNSHYLQNRLSSAGAKQSFYVTGKGPLESVGEALGKMLADHEVAALDSLQGIETSMKEKDYPLNQQAMSLSLGLGLSFLGVPHLLKMDLIEEKSRKIKRAAGLKFFKGAAFLSLAAVTIFALSLDVRLLKRVSAQAESLRQARSQVQSLIPQVKALQEERERLDKMEGEVRAKAFRQPLYLDSLARLSEAKPAGVILREFDAEGKEGRVQVVVSGRAGKYEDINVFLAELKKKARTTDVKVVASTFPEASPEASKDASGIDFKLRFVMQASQGAGVAK
jgi:type II secretory pathway component PulL